MTTTNANASHAVQAQKSGSGFVTFSFHSSPKDAARAAQDWVARGFTAKVVTL